MKLRVILSNNFCDADNVQIDLLGEGLRAGREQIVFAPDAQCLSLERNILDRLNLRATFGVKVMSLSQFAGEILPTGSECVLSKVGSVMLVEMLVDRLKQQFVCFRETQLTISFSESLFASIQLLQSCRITPQKLAEILPQITSKPLQQKLQDILLIYTEYENYKSGKWLDAGDRMCALASAVRAADCQNCDIHFCEINSMSAVDFAVLAAFAERANSVSVGVLQPVEGQRNADLIFSDVYPQVLDFCEKMGVAPEVISAQSELPEFTQHILKNALAVSPQKVECDNGAVEIYEASNPRLEVEFVAADILQKVRSGARFRDFAINCANLEGYEQYIRTIFAEAKIPVWIDTKYPLAFTELGKLIFAILDFASDGLQVKDIYRIISNSLANISREDCELYKNVTARYGITGERLLDVTAPKNVDLDFERYLQINQKLQFLFDFCGKITTLGTVFEYIEALNAIWESFSVAPQLGALGKSLRDEGDFKRGNIASKSYQKFKSILENMGKVVGDMRCDFAEFCKILRSAVANEGVSPLPIRLDCVKIGGSATAFESVDYYYIMCATEGNFSSAVSDVGLISDYDIAALEGVNLKISPCIREKNALSRLMMINNLCFAKKKITFSYPLCIDEENCELANAVVSVQKMFTANGEKLKPINIEAYYNLEFNPARANEIVDLRYYDKNRMMRAFASGVSASDLRGEDLALQKSLEEFLEKNEPQKVEKLAKMCGNLREIPNLNNPSAVFFAEGKAGVTQIERFFDCPYAHFLSYGLKIKEKRSANIQATDVGNLLHAVLEDFGRKLSREGVQDMAQIPPYVDAVFDKLLSCEDYENLVFGGGNKALISALKKEAVRACEAVNYQMSHSQYKVKFVEAKFGTDCFVPVPEIAIVNSDLRVKISGKIDRADVCGSKLRIIDYKTSKNSADFRLLNFYLGKKIQLFYYMAVILDNLPYSPSGAFYLPVHKEYTEGEVMTPYSNFCMQGMPLDDGADILCQDDQMSFDHPKSDIVKFELSTSKEAMAKDEFVLKNRVKASRESFALMLRYAKQVLAGAINDIYSGYIEPSHFEKSCEYCKFKNICRVSVFVQDKVRADNFDIEKTAPFACKSEEK